MSVQKTLSSHFAVKKGFSSTRLIADGKLQRKRTGCPLKETEMKKAHIALHSEVPSELPCREKEMSILEEFLLDNLENHTSASMYISGPPGSGKTACLSIAMSHPKVAGHCKIVYINCTSVKSANSLYSKIVDELGLKKKMKPGKKYLNVLTEYFSTSKLKTLLVLDEIDQLESRNCSLLYTVFEWPSLPDSKILLIGIANALDLTERTLTRLQNNPAIIKPQSLHFASYNKQQIGSIVKHRLNEANVGDIFPDNAINLLAGKVAAVSGDARRALDIARRVVDLAENKLSVGNSETPCVQLNDVLSVINCVYASTSQILQSKDKNTENEELPLQQKLILCSILSTKRSLKQKQDLTVGKLHDTYRKICERKNLFVLDLSEFVSVCSLIEARGILALKGKVQSRMTKVQLHWDEKEMITALQDKTLLADILCDRLF